MNYQQTRDAGKPSEQLQAETAARIAAEEAAKKSGVIENKVVEPDDRADGDKIN